MASRCTTNDVNSSYTDRTGSSYGLVLSDHSLKSHVALSGSVTPQGTVELILAESVVRG